MITRITLFILLANLTAAAQPQLVRDIAPGTTSSISSNSLFSRLTALGNTVLFKANDGVTGQELWRSDGTPDGTELIKDIYAGTGQDGVSDFFIVFDSILYFQGRNSDYGAELWRSDGTSAGTFLFWDACVGSCDGPSYGNFFPEFAMCKNTLFFRSSKAGSGTEIFYTNGDSSSVTLLTEISSGAGSSSPGRLCVWNDLLFFVATQFSSARELWITDGTSGGTKLVKDINPGGSSASDPNNLTPAGDQLFFSATVNGAGRELWKTDGTEAGTIMVRDINPGSGNGVTDLPFQILGDLLIFAANDGINGIELWISDGTEPGTQLLKNIGPGASNSLVRYLGRLDDKLFYAADGGSGTELWITDGTSDGTKLVKEIFPGLSGGVYSGGPAYNGNMYFTANDGVNGIELWQTDGTTAGTTLLADISAGIAGSDPSNLTLVGSTLYFFASTTAYGRELWRYDLRPPVATFSAPDSVCQSETAIFTALTPAADTWLWQFGTGAQPAQAQGPGPHTVTFNTPGEKTVLLIVSNTFGSDTAIQALTVFPIPQTDFNSQADDLSVTFINSSMDAVSYLWSFGDGEQSNEANPIHVYPAPGTYTVTLDATNNCSTVEKSMILTLTSAQRQLADFPALRVYPNPATHELRINTGLPKLERLQIVLYEALGSVVHAASAISIPDTDISIDTSSLSPGFYWLQISTTEGQRTTPVIILQEEQ